MACGPGFPELSKSDMDMVRTLCIFTFTHSGDVQTVMPLPLSAPMASSGLLSLLLLISTGGKLHQSSAHLPQLKFRKSRNSTFLCLTGASLVKMPQVLTDEPQQLPTLAHTCVLNILHSNTVKLAEGDGCVRCPRSMAAYIPPPADVLARHCMYTC